MATPKQGYRNSQGVKIPSVTTVLSRFKDSGALVQWAYKQGREHENLAMRNLEGPAHLYDVTGKAALAGTIAHDLIEAHILGLPGKRAGRPVCVSVAWEKHATAPKDVLARAHNAYHQFLAWLDNTKLTITHTEMGLVSERYQFGGTLDAIGRDAQGNICLLDWKSSNAVYDDYLYQLAGYSLLLEEMRPELAPENYHLLRVAKETADFAHHYYGELDEEKKIFLAMRKLYGMVSVPRHKRTRQVAVVAATDDEFDDHT
jgi:hypothetical protein